MIPIELVLGAWLMTKGGWQSVWMAFGLIVLVEVVLQAFTGISAGEAISSFIEQAVFMISDLATGVL